jgi:hypothetical protein
LPLSSQSSHPFFLQLLKLQLKDRMGGLGGLGGLGG